MRAGRFLRGAILWFAALAVSAIPLRAGTDEAEESAPLPRVEIVVRGEADVTLTDPAGRTNAMSDTGVVNRIPGCRRIVEERTTKDPAPAATVFTIEEARSGLYAVRVRGRSAGMVRIEVGATPVNGPPCEDSDSVTLKTGERLVFSVSIEPLRGEGETGCVVRAGHRHAPLVPKKKKS